MIHPIPAFHDNYIWLFRNPENSFCTVVDPGDAKPVIDFLKKENLTLDTILITHHHPDHIGGVSALKQAFDTQVYGPETITEVTHPVRDGEQITLRTSGTAFTVTAVPGHTLDHLAYHNEDWLFCGDTLFSGGCGRLFEGEAEQLYASLNQLKNLHDSIQVFCAHEYTEANLRFAQVVEPNNTAIQAHLDKVKNRKGKPSLPSTIGKEKAINPFLRCEEPAVIEAAENHSQTQLPTPEQVFATLRRWKDNF